MTKLVVRKIPWDFDASVPFMWQPANPDFGLFCNAFTFVAVPFERYIVSVVRKAADRLDQDPAIASEADAFLRQEAQHAAAMVHRRCSTRCRRASWSRWCGGSGCRRRPTTIPPTNRCPTGRIPGCANTTAVPT